MTRVPDVRSGEPSDAEMRRFLADCDARRLGWALFQKYTRRSALSALRNIPTERP